MTILNRATLPIDDNCELVLQSFGQRGNHTRMFATWMRDKNNHGLWQPHYFPVDDQDSADVDERESLALLTATADFLDRCWFHDAQPEC